LNKRSIIIMRTPISIFLAALLGLAFILPSCTPCGDPTSPSPTPGLPDIMYTYYLNKTAPTIFTAKADGSGQRPYATTSGYLTSNGLLMSSPRNGRLAFISGGEGGPVSLVVADVAGTNATVVEANAEFDDVLYPVLSPDAKKVVVVRHHQAPVADVVVYDVATGTKKVIATDIQNESQVVFTPNGSELAYYTSDRRIVMMGIDGSNARTLVRDAYSDNDYSCFLDFSPQGDRMVYMRGTTGNIDLAVYTLATQTTTTLRSEPGVLFAQPAWAPNGASIAYVRTTTSNDRVVLARCTLQGAETVLMSEAEHWPQFPQWSPDGGYLSSIVTIGPQIDKGTFSLRVFNTSSNTSTLIGNDLVLSFWVR
jgi:Tol biopolymer transport system component